MRHLVMTAALIATPALARADNCRASLTLLDNVTTAYRALADVQKECIDSEVCRIVEKAAKKLSSDDDNDDLVFLATLPLDMCS